MIFNIVWDEKAYSELNKIEPSISRRVFKKIDELSENPFSKDIKKLKGSNDFRLRVGDYRVIFSINNGTIHILKVGHRKNVYD